MKLKKLLKRLQLDDMIIDDFVYTKEEAMEIGEFKIESIGATKLDSNNYHSCPTILIRTKRR